MTTITVADLTPAEVELIAELRRMFDEEGHSPAEDDMQSAGQLGQAAGAYALHAASVLHKQVTGLIAPWEPSPALLWPWGPDSWKPDSPRRTVIKAVALLLAEAGRLDRLTQAQGPGDE